MRGYCDTCGDKVPPDSRISGQRYIAGNWRKFLLCWNCGPKSFILSYCGCEKCKTAAAAIHDAKEAHLNAA